MVEKPKKNPYAKLVKNFKLQQLIETGRDKNLATEHIPFLIKSIESVLAFVNYEVVRNKSTFLMFEDIHEDYLKAIDILESLSGTIPYRWISQYYFNTLYRDSMKSNWQARRDCLEKLSTNIELALRSDPNNKDFVLDKIHLLVLDAKEFGFQYEVALNRLFDFLQTTALTTEDYAIWSNWLACINLLRKSKDIKRSYLKNAINEFFLTSRMRLDEGSLAADEFLSAICDPDLGINQPQQFKLELPLFINAAIVKQQTHLDLMSSDDLEIQSGIYINIFANVTPTREVVMHAKELAERSWDLFKSWNTLQNFVTARKHYALFIKRTEGDEAGSEALLSETETIKKNFEAKQKKLLVPNKIKSGKRRTKVTILHSIKPI